MPHGNYKTFDEVRDFLNEMNEERCGYIIRENVQAIGCLEIEVKEDHKGFFDIVLIKDNKEFLDLLNQYYHKSV